MLFVVFPAGFDFDFLGTSQENGWEEHLQSDLFTVRWDVKSHLDQSAYQSGSGGLIWTAGLLDGNSSRLCLGQFFLCDKK